MQSNDSDIRRQLENEAVLGELAGTMVHEFNNFLNTLLLQITMMESTAPPALSPDLALIRTEGKKIAKIIKDWQAIKKTRPGMTKSFDFNQIIRELIHDPVTGPFSSAKIKLELAEEPLWIQGSILDLHHLCFLLIQSALKASESQAGDQGNVIIRTQRKQQEACLTVCDSGSTLSPAALGELFDPNRSARSGLELAACKALTRRLGGRLLRTTILKRESP